MRYRETVSRRALKVTSVMALVVGMTGASEACRTATQVELDVTYDGLCTDLQEVAFIVGTDPTVAESRIETNVFTTTTSHCEPGSPSRVGTLVVTPNDATGRASIIVLASFGGQHVTDCKPEKGYAGCIIARRAFAFVDHTALTLEIPLEVSCKNVPCDAVSTCKHASCVSSETMCTGSGCGDVGVSADGGPEYVDAPTDPDGYVQSRDAEPPPVDGAPPADAAPDGPIVMMDAAVDTGAGRCYPFEPVSCSPTGAAGPDCATGEVCCRSFPTFFDAEMPMQTPYACRAPASCYTDMSQGSATVVRCRSSRNCPTGNVCCLNTMTANGESMCMTSCAFSGFDSGPTFPQACESSCECPNGKACNVPQSPNGVTYMTCAQ
jgi:hypothetical protein